MQWSVACGEGDEGIVTKCGELTLDGGEEREEHEGG